MRDVAWLLLGVSTGEGLVVWGRAIDHTITREPTTEDVLAMSEDIAALHAVVDIVPCRFGTTVEDRAHAHDVLVRKGDAFRRALDRIAGHTEFGLRFILNETILSQIEERDDGCVADTPIDSGRAYLLAKQRALRDERARGQRAARAVRQHFCPLTDLATQIFVPPLKHTSVGDVCSVALLVPRAASEDLQEVFARAQEWEEGTSLHGPFAPYSFSTLGRG